MSKKSIIAILSAVVLMVVASIAMVFTIGPKTSADSEVIETVPVKYLSINDGVLGDNSFSIRNAFNADGKTWIQNHAKYRVEIPEGVTSISNYAFQYCSGLTSITIPAGVTSIGSWTFSGCSGLTSVTFAENSQLTSIDGCAFQNCSGLTSITIPNSVTSIGVYVFENCGLNEIIVRNPDLMTNTNLQPYASLLRYGADQNTVTFNTMGGTEVPDQIINFGELIEVPNTEKEGYHVTGWYLDEEYTKPFTLDTPVKYDINLYAKWKEGLP